MLVQNIVWPLPVWPAQPYVELLNLLRPLKSVGDFEGILFRKK